VLHTLSVVHVCTDLVNGVDGVPDSPVDVGPLFRVHAVARVFFNAGDKVGPGLRKQGAEEKRALLVIAAVG
jgi:hypothetical protein